MSKPGSILVSAEGWIEDVAKLVARQAIEMSVGGVEFGPKLSTALFVPAPQRSREQIHFRS
jgi:hypothetical protein